MDTSPHLPHVLIFRKEVFLELYGLHHPPGKKKNITLPHSVELVSNSGKVRPNCVFLSLCGRPSHIKEAVKLGAGTLLIGEGASCKPPSHWPGNLLKVKDVHAFFALLLNTFYGFPSRQMMCIGVTGTNGKTTTSHILHFTLSALNWETALLGTIFNQFADHRMQSHLTTPGMEELYCFMNGFLTKRADSKGRSHKKKSLSCKKGAEVLIKKESENSVVEKNNPAFYRKKALVTEVSSHGLKQRRVEGVDFDIVVFTNLSPDHLDYHANMENYYQAKKKLFQNHKTNYRTFFHGRRVPGAPTKRKITFAVINQDDPFGRRLIREVSIPKVTFGQKKDDAQANEPDFTWELLSCGLFQTEFLLRKKTGGSWRVKLALPGVFNVVNAVGALIAGELAGESMEKLILQIADFKGIPGRLEHIKLRQAPTVFIDYAHTQVALEQVLSFLKSKKLKERKLICVFGCGGDRDKEKRPQMGKTGVRFSDRLIITTDNPRGEDPQSIAEDCLRALPEREDIKDGQNGVDVLSLDEGICQGDDEKSGKDKIPPPLKGEAPSYRGKERSRKGQVVSSDQGFSQKRACKVFLELDRKQAIRKALSLAKKGDIVLIAGKGHESRQVLAGKIVHFNDKDCVRALWREMHPEKVN